MFLKTHRYGKFLFSLLMAAVIAALGVQLYQTTQEKDQIKIIYIPKIIDDTNEFWSSVIEGAKAAAREYGIELELTAPELETDVNGQNQMISDAIGQMPDAIVVSASSYTETTPYIKEAADRHIKVVLIDSGVDEDLAESMVSTDNFQAGEKLGSYMRSVLPKNPRIGLIGYVNGASTAIERERGIRAGLLDAQDFIVDVVFCDSVYQTAYDVTLQLFHEYPDINMIAGFNEYSSLGAATAIKDMGLKEQVLVFGFDSSVSQIQLLEEGVYRALVVQNAFNMGYLGIEQAVKSVNGEAVDKYIDSGSVLIKKEEIYTEENEKILFPFSGSRATRKEEIRKQ